MKSRELKRLGVPHGESKGRARKSYVPRETPAPYRQWGEDLEPQSVQQLVNACSLPISVRGELEARGVVLISAGLDEVPGVYKDIHRVMAAQSDLVEPLAQFQPRLVKMAPPGERPED